MMTCSPENCFLITTIKQFIIPYTYNFYYMKARKQETTWWTTQTYCITDNFCGYLISVVFCSQLWTEENKIAEYNIVLKKISDEIQILTHYNWRGGLSL
jgi:hypothetical protein